MKYLAHRGLWNHLEEKNSMESFIRAIENGFGIETDIRDYIGKLVISHDIPKENPLFLDTSLFTTARGLIAWNIKSDGLIPLISNSFSEDLLSNSVFFDMSLPETLQFRKHNLPYLIRLSEYESMNELSDSAIGVWIDSFHGLWFDIPLLTKIIQLGKIIVFASFELHQRDLKELWLFIKNNGLHLNDSIYLCTDVPIKAKEFFSEK